MRCYSGELKNNSKIDLKSANLVVLMHHWIQPASMIKFFFLLHLSFYSFSSLVYQWAYPFGQGMYTYPHFTFCHFAFRKDLHQNLFSLTEWNPKGFLLLCKQEHYHWAFGLQWACFRSSEHPELAGVAPPSYFPRNCLQHPH